MSTSSSGKTVITLDLQLYSKCVQLQAREEISSKFVFRMGELHVVFAALKCIGKFIDNSGLDAVFIEAGIYGPTTVEQIKGGKHMKRSLEAYTTLYIALFLQHVEKILQYNPEIEKEVREGSIRLAECLENCRSMRKQELQSVLADILQMVQSSGFIDAQQRCEKELYGQAKFLHNFMRMFESLLLFIRATRTCNWELHLASLQELSKYFFAFDLQNYARLAPVYLSQMYDLKANDPEMWSFLQQNVSVNKNRIPFSAIGPDHAIEHENRAMKVLGGVKGIANKPSALDMHFVVMPEMGYITEEFNAMFGIETKKRDEH